MSEAYLFLGAGFLGGLFAFGLFFRLKVKSFEKLGQALIDKAEESVRLEEGKSQKRIESENKKLNAKRAKLRQEAEREHLKVAEKKLELSKEQEELKKSKELLGVKLKELQKKEASQTEQQKVYQQALEKLASMTEEEGQKLLLDQMKDKLKEQAAQAIQAHQKEVQKSKEATAAKVIATAIGRTAVSTASTLTLTTVALPDEGIKGRIIGREGRNIRALEQATGVNFLLDDTPKAIVISGFDPLRREVAKKTLVALLQDGRIHPTRIDEVVSEAQAEITNEIDMLGEEAALKCGVEPLHPSLITHLGKLGFRYSYAQNVLKHSIEVSHLLGFMAAELGLDQQRAKRMGLLHDIGKGALMEKSGSHALLGQELALKYGESEEVANGIGCHHGEIEPRTIEGSLCSAADALSGGRPGARIEALEHYVKRLHDLETLTKEFKGVERAYALQAGKEVRVVVTPDLFDDASVINLARAIALKIESSLTYSGKIKVTVIRETQAVEYAL